MARACTPVTWPGSSSALGHSVEVFAGQPWPVLDDGVGFTPVPGLDLYRDPDPFRVPHPREFHSSVDLLEFGVMCTAGFPEPRTFSLRARRLLAARRGDFDLVHDNQCLGSGLLGMMEDGWPLLTTLHHPITVDRVLALSHAENAYRRLTQRRWFGFLGMQMRVAKQLPRIVTVSESSKTDITAQMGVDLSRMTVVPVGVDHTVFRPRPDRPRIPGRIMVTSSSDVPMKGLVPLLEALAKLRTERDVELVVIGRPTEGGRVARTIDRLGLVARRALCERDLRRRARRDVRRGPGGRGAVAVRGLLVARHRGHGVRCPVGGHHRGCASRGGGRATARRPCWSRPTIPRPWRRASVASSTTTPWRLGWERAAASACSGASRGRPRRVAPPSSTGCCSKTTAARTGRTRCRRGPRSHAGVDRPC